MAKTDIDELRIVIEADDNASDKLQDLLDKLEALGNVSTNSSSLKDFSAQMNNLSEKVEEGFSKVGDVIRSASGEMESFADKTAKVGDGSKIEKIGNDIREVSEIAKDATKGVEELATYYENIRFGDTSFEAPKAGETLKRELQEIEWNANATEQKLSRLGKVADDAFNRASKSVATFGKNMAEASGKLLLFPFNSVAKGVANLTRGIGKLFTKLKTVAVYRALRGFIKMITEGFKEGTQNAYQWSKALGDSGKMVNGRYVTFAGTMDRLATSAMYLRNSFGAMATPLINAVAPALDFIIDKIVAALNAINMLIARLTGASSWTKALRYPKEFASGLDSASGSAKKLNDELITILGIDEINPLEGAKDNGSGGGGGAGDALDYASMFEEVALETGSTFEKFFDPFVKAWDNKGAKVMASIDNALNGIKRLAKDVAHSFWEVWTNGTGQESIEHLLGIFTGISNTIGNITNGIAKAWEESGRGTQIIQNLWDTLNLILGMWDRIANVTAEWAKDLDFAPLLESIKNLTGAFKDLAEPITGAIAWGWEHVLLPLAKWGIEKAVPETIESLALAFSSFGRILDAIGKSKAGEVIRKILDVTVELAQRVIGATWLQPFKDFAKILSDIADILTAKKTLKQTFFEWAEDIMIRLQTRTHYLAEAWRALKEFRWSDISDALMNAYDPTHSDYYLGVKARIEGVDDARSKKDKLLEFKASVRGLDEDNTTPAGGNFKLGGVTGISFARPQLETLEIDVEGRLIGVTDNVPTRQKTVGGMTAWLQEKKESFNKTTGEMTAWLSKKSEAFNKTTGDMTAHLSKKSELFNKTTDNMVASLTTKKESFSKTSDNMTANFATKKETFTKSTDMTANMTKWQRSFTGTWAKQEMDGFIANQTKWQRAFTGSWKDQIMTGFTSKAEKFKDGIKSADKTISGVTATVTGSLKKGANFSGLTLSGTVSGGGGGKMTLQVKKSGGAFYGNKWHSIPQYANGTLNAGSLFIAGEAGAEIVGNVNGRSEVLNRSQIASAMASSMSQASAVQNRLLAEQNELLRQLVSKDSTVTAILSTSAFTDGATRQNRRNGRTVIPVGV